RQEKTIRASSSKRSTASLRFERLELLFRSPSFPLELLLLRSHADQIVPVLGTEVVEVKLRAGRLPVLQAQNVREARAGSGLFARVEHAIGAGVGSADDPGAALMKDVSRLAVDRPVAFCRIRLGSIAGLDLRRFSIRTVIQETRL